MKIETTPRDDHQLKVVVELEPEQLERGKRQAARKIAQETKIPGFRPGKAPYEVVRRMVGEDTIQKEALALLVDETYPKVIEEAGIKPYGPGTLADAEKTDPITFTFIIPLEPKVELGDYRSIRVPYEPPVVEEKEVDAFIQRLRNSYATLTPAERPAQEGDLVFVSVSGKRVNPAEGENETLAENRVLQVPIQPADQVDENEWPYPGFARELIGAEAGQELTLRHTFEDDSPYESLRGKEAEYTVKIDSVKAMELPELDAPFAQTVGEFETVDALRESIRKSLEATAKEDYDNEYFTKILDQIREQATIQYPPQALDNEENQVINSIERDLARQNLDLETYLKIRKEDREAFKEQEVRPAAVRRLERSLLMDEISLAEHLHLDEKEFASVFSQTMNELQGTSDFNQMRKKVSSDRLANAVAMEAASRLINRQVFDRLKLIANGEEIPEDTNDHEHEHEVEDEKTTEKKPSEQPSTEQSE
ncbi:MAG TPA: trigger factor [Anaerolineaceae bacterium]|nr:trigger factor [Anaerolineaceae bacterium]